MASLSSIFLACAGSPDQVTPKEDGDDFQKALAAVAEKGKMGSWHYTRFFAIGLFRLLELTGQLCPSLDDILGAASK